MRKPTICIYENKAADQLNSNCEADQHLCFHYMDSKIPLLFKSKISSLQPSSVLVQLNQTLCSDRVQPVQKPYYWFSDVETHMVNNSVMLMNKFKSCGFMILSGNQSDKGLAYNCHNFIKCTGLSLQVLLK